MTNMAEFGQDAVQRALADATRAYVGQGKRYSVRLAADASLVCESAIKNYLAATATPGLPGFLRLLSVLGPEWGNALTRMAGYELVPVEPDAISEYVLNHHSSELVTAIAQALSDDGRIDHMEKADMKPLVEKLHASTGAWLRENT